MQFLENLRAASSRALQADLSIQRDEARPISYVVVPIGGFYPNKPEWEPIFTEQLREAPEWNRESKEFAPVREERVVELLWNEGKVPMWIDIHVVSDSPEPTIALLCSGIRTSADYYYGAGDARGRTPWLERPPFQILESVSVNTK
jgi:hypothetical protein